MSGKYCPTVYKHALYSQISSKTYAVKFYHHKLQGKTINLGKVHQIFARVRSDEGTIWPRHLTCIP